MTAVCSACLDLSLPKPLDQSKNVTLRSYQKLSKDQNGPKNRQIGKKLPKWQKTPKPPKRHVAKPGEARQSVVTSII